MSPDIDLRLRTMIAAMTDIIIPAIGQTDALATEQAKLLIGALTMLREQVDYSHAYETIETQECIALAKNLAVIVGNDERTLEAALASAQTALSAPVIATSELRHASRALRDTIRLLVERANKRAPDIQAVVRRAVLDHSEAMTLRERAWVAGTGFDVQPETLRSIPQSLGLAVRGEQT